jgi:malonyl CoA-acyl carrier protein transacylase
MSRVRGGGMAAIVGATPAQIAAVLSRSGAGRRLDIAKFNSYDQTVIAGAVDDLASVRADFEAAGVRAYIPLKVSAAFHSRQMSASMEEFAAVLLTVAFGEPRIQVISNVTATPYVARDVRETLSRQIGSSVNWLGSIEYLLAQGVVDFQEVGPGKVLTKLAASIRKTRETHAPAGPSAPS